MAHIVIRDLDDALADRLKRRATVNHRSLEAEVKAILEHAAPPRMTADESRAAIERWQARWRAEGRTFSDSAELIREVRDA